MNALSANQIRMSRFFCGLVMVLITLSINPPLTANAISHSSVSSEAEGPGTWITAYLSSGESVRIWLLDQQNADFIVQNAAQVRSKQPNMLRQSSAPPEVIVLLADDIDVLTDKDTDFLREMADARKPLIFEGHEPELAKLLNMQAVDQTVEDANEYVTLRIDENGIPYWAHFFEPAQLVKETFLVTENGMQAASGEAETIVSNVSDRGGTIMFREALRLAVEPEITTSTPEVPKALESTGENQGAWNSIWKEEWTWFGEDLPRDIHDIANVFKVTATGFKINDGYENEDWYLVDLKVSHEANVPPVSYEENFPWYCGDGGVGWYVQERYVKVARIYNWEQIFLEDYGPAGTIGSGSVSISIGGGINVGKEGPEGGTQEHGRKVITNQMSRLLIIPVCFIITPIGMRYSNHQEVNTQASQVL